MISATDEQLVVEYHDAKLSAISNIGRVIPGPLYFKDRREFFSSWAAADELNTQTGIELAGVNFVSFWLSGFSDDPTSPRHSPLVTLNYDFYLFREYTLERQNEANTDETAMARRQLKVYRLFVQTLLDIKAAYQGDINLGVLDTNIFVKQFSTPQELPGTIGIQEECEFVPRVVGLSAQMQCGVQLRLKEC